MASLHLKLIGVLLFLLVPLGALFVLLSFYSSDAYRRETNQHFNRSLAENIARSSLLMIDGQANKDALMSIFDDLKQINPSIDVYLLSPTGSILAASAANPLRHGVTLEPLQRFMNGGTLPILGDDPLSDGRVIFSAAAIPAQGTLEAYLYLVLEDQTYLSTAHRLRGSYVLRLAAGVMGVGLAFSLALGGFSFMLLTRRLRRLSSAVTAFIPGESLSLPYHVAGNGDEVDRLSAAFLEMTHTIGRQVQSLQEADTLRRELIGNVSHDLRTPLAAMRGYLETLSMKAGTLPPAQEAEYLQIALRHSDRLGSLISELFELTKLDTGQTTLQCEPFSVAELFQDITQRFRLRAQADDISLHYQCRTSLVAYADLQRIEQVITNLLDNALNHTPSGGSVSLHADEDGGRIVLWVEDNGSGIAAENLPHIFERYYRAPRTQATETHNGAGLGLAIARRIVELHGGRLEVKSTLGEGSLFSFSVARAGRQRDTPVRT